MDDFPVSSAGQIEAAREHVARVAVTVPRVAVSVRPSRIVPLAVIGPLTCLVAVIAPFALVVMLLDP